MNCTVYRPAVKAPMQKDRVNYLEMRINPQARKMVTIVGVLIAVPVMLMLVKIRLRTKTWFEVPSAKTF